MNNVSEDAAIQQVEEATARRLAARKANGATKPAAVKAKPAKAKPAKAKKAVVVIDKKADQVAEKAAKVTEANKKLDPIAKAINVRLEKAAKLEGDADDHRLAAALETARAAQVCEAAGIKFKDWAADHLTGQSWEKVRKLLYIGKSDEPAKALADLRDGTKKAQAKHRDKTKAKLQAAPVKLIEAPKPAEIVAGLKPEEQVALVKKTAKDLGLAVVSETDAKALDQFRKTPPAKAAPVSEPSPVGYDAIIKAVSSLKASEKLKLARWLADVVGYDLTAKTVKTAEADLEIPDFLKK
jgi:hypothetical protein